MKTRMAFVSQNSLEPEIWSGVVVAMPFCSVTRYQSSGGRTPRWDGLEHGMEQSWRR